MNYRAEIDGLRAISVISVILFHAGFEWFSGGFIGVDVFFVISGYLITTILIEDIEKKQFSILAFYERRARRILPALFFIMLVSIGFAWMWMLPSAMRDFSESLIAVSLFLSNVYFWRTNGYFDPAAEEKPLLHTWSLAVEEQYYIIFPIFLILAWRFGKNRVFWMIVVMAAISLLLSEWGWRNKPTANFYLAPTRAWELLAGSIAAFIVQNNGIKQNNLLALLGLFAIIFSIFSYNVNTPFPSVYTLVPVLGAMLLVLSGGKETLVAKLLSIKILVGIGLISYSAYLWHQPLFAFARVGLYEYPSQYLMIILSITSLVLAFFTWRYVERPFRQQSFSTRKIIFSSSLLGIIFFIFIGYQGISNNGYRDRYIDVLAHLEWMSSGDRAHTEGYPCVVFKNTQYSALELCQYGDIFSNKTLITYGDSHLDAISYELNTLAQENNIRIVKASIKGCEVIFNISLRPEKSNLSEHYYNCNNGFEQLYQLISFHQANVLVVSRWTYQMFPAPGVVDQLNFNNGVGGQEVDLPPRVSRAIFSDGSSSIEWEHKRDAMLKLLKELAHVSKQLFINYPIPEMGWDIFDENTRSIRNTGNLVESLMYPNSTYYLRNDAVIGVLKDLEKSHSNIELIRSDLVFCNSIQRGFCVGQIDDTIYYLDDDHLSDLGARLLLKQVSNSLFD